MSQEGNSASIVGAPPPGGARAAIAHAGSAGTTLRSHIRLTRRGIQIALGCIWLLDGLLQFQSYMYTHDFISQVILPTAQSQPGVISDPITTIGNFYGRDLTLWNTIAAEIQCAIGLGLIVSRRTVRPALLLSFGWAVCVWWFGEGLGTILSGAPVSPLMGAPGAVIVYGLIGLLVWPRRGEDVDGAPVDGGLLGRHGGEIVWSVLWGEAAVLWFLNVNRSKTAIHDQISGMASASPHWLASPLNSVANSSQGHGVAIATLLGIVSIIIAVGVWTPARPAVLAAGLALSLAYWVFGQSLGGPFWAGQATDVNAGPLFALLALTVFAQPRAVPQTTSDMAAARPPGHAVATA